MIYKKNDFVFSYHEIENIGTRIPTLHIGFPKPGKMNISLI